MPRFRPAVRPLEDRCTPATLVVNTTADDFTADNFLTLREANFLIQSGGSTANFTAGGGRALTAGEQAQISGAFTALGGGAADTINFAPSLTGQTITLTQDDPFATAAGTGLAFASNTFISGLGAFGLTISGGGQRRLFDVFGGTLTVENLTLADGTATNVLAPLTGAAGGAIVNTGATLALNYVTFRNNVAAGGANTGNGGAVFNLAGTLTVTNSTFNGNSATGVGGGFGGAIATLNGSTTLTNVTVSGNVGSGGRGLSAITAAGFGGPAPALTLNNNIFGEADQSVPDVTVFAAGGPQFNVSGSSNLVRNTNAVSVGGTGLPATLIVSSADPLLAPLAFNGGPIQTMYPKGGSPVLNAGNNATAANPIDPRGKNRVSGGAVELGAVEVQASAFAVGVGSGSSQPVRVYNSEGTQTLAINAYAAGYTGGVFVAATGDFNFDGVPDIVTSTGPGGSANIRVFDGFDGSLLNSFFGYPEAFTGGVNVAVADVNFDGFVDIICGVGKGGGPNVRVFSGKDNSLLLSQFVYPEAFTGGVRVTAADVNNDGYADIICGVGSGGGPNVRVIDGRTSSLLNSFFAYPAGFTGGLFLAAGDLNGDGLVDIATGVESGGGPNVRAFDANTLASVSSFFAYDQNQTGGVRVATADVNGDGYSDYITGSGPSSTGLVRVISGKDASTNLLAPFTPFGSLVDVAGVNVG